MKTKFNKLLLIASASILFSGCVGTKMSPQQENALGAQQEQKVLRSTKPSHNRTLTAAVNRVGKRIARAANRPQYQWRFHLIDSPQANAFVLPGGKVFVYTGLFKYASSDAELAIVMGHEVAHALKSHGVQGAERAKTAGMLGAALKIGLGAAGVDASKADMINKAYGVSANLGFIKPHSRGQETEADSIGLMLAAKAKYNPNAAISFWTKFGAAGQRTSEFLSTHPAPQNRIANLKRLMPQAMKLYRN